MLRYYLFAALGCLAVTQAARIIQAPPESVPQNTQTQPDFCNLECPEFEPVCQTDDYEVRRYQDAKWVSTTVTGISLTTAGMRGFWRLFNYIGGDNDAGVKIPMTQPVLMQIPTKRANYFSSQYTVSFLLPRMYWDNPPGPTNAEVFLEHTPELIAYVKSYGGWATGWNAYSYYEEIVEKLVQNNETFQDEYYFSAQYDAPFQITDRRNEVWVLGARNTDREYTRRRVVPSCARGNITRENIFDQAPKELEGNALPQCGDRENFCLDNDCPEYEVIESYDSGIERRRYSGIKMVTVSTNQCDIALARKKGFWALFNYINGSNSYEEKIEMTAPVLLDVMEKEVSREEDSSCDKTYNVSFYIPEEHQLATPEPIKDGVFLRTIDLDVYVQCFSGHASTSDIAKNSRVLRQWLRTEGRCHKRGVMHAATYSSPGMLFGRHNEIWLDADDQCTEQVKGEVTFDGDIRHRQESKKDLQSKLEEEPRPDPTSPDILPVSSITDKPAECETSECPTYKTVKTYDNFVERSVINAMLVCTKTVSCSYEMASIKSFHPLFEYIRGQNSEGINIAMTAPVLTKMVKVEDGDSCEKEYTTCFYLPKEYQENPPKPNNDQVFIDANPVLDTYVMAFGGWATDEKVDQLVETFTVNLVNKYVPYTAGFIVASYDAPWKRTRYNELWNLKAGAKSKPSYDSDESVEDTAMTALEIADPVHEKCVDTECPEYQTIKRFNNFEERRILPGMWVCKKSRDCSPTQSSSSFWSLFNYISGRNDKNATIAMTAPVIRKMNPADLGRTGCDKESTMCFWLPKEHQGDPPRPTEDGVYLYKSRGPVAYVMTYGGVQEKERDFARRALKFMHIMDGAGISFKPEYVKAVTYDGPRAPINKRVNEIWLIKPEDTNISEEDSDETLEPVEEKCRREECPEFKTVKQHDGFVERSIVPGTWVCKNIRGCSVMESQSAYWSLYGYFTGSNSRKVKITMTSPVLHAMNPADLTKDSCDKLSKVCFWLPKEQQQDPPQPTEEGVYLYQSRGPAAYVMTYSGVRAEGEEDFADRARKFMGMLDEAGLEYKPEYVKAVKYDGPNVPVRKRVHEIWLIKPDESSREIVDPVSEKCKRIECPEYKTVKEHDGFEERRIKPGMWVCKKSTGCSTSQTSGAFMSLFYYISGANSKNMKIDMTAPVLRVVNPADLGREGCDKEVKTCFWLPEKHQKNPPEPTEEGVFLYKSRGPVAYVMTYSGGKMGREEEFSRRAKEFMGKLDWAGIKYKPEYVKSVGYDGPNVADNKRVMEIWLIKPEDTEDYTGEDKDTMEKRCLAIDCPNYWGIKKHDGFEERRMMPGTWVCKNVSGCSMEEATTEFTWSMFAYMRGGNSKKTKIDMRVPIVRWMNPAILGTSGCNKDYRMCFWLPQKHQEDPPLPQEEGVYLYQSRGPVVYAMLYDSPRDKQDEVFTQRATKFMDMLDATGIQYKPEYVKSVVYIGPSPSVKELHEVWLVKPERAEDYTGEDKDSMEKRCLAIDCPNYWGIKKHDGFEERRIMPGTWVCRNVSGCSMEEATTEFTWSMFAYMRGGNSKKTKIDMRVPIVRWMNPAILGTSGCNKNYRMCSWLPQEHQEDPPLPQEEGVYLYRSRGPVVYAMLYDSPRDKQDEVFTQRATKFMDMLDATGVQYKPEYVKSVVYIGPSPSAKELHEVWLVQPDRSDEGTGKDMDTVRNKCQVLDCPEYLSIQKHDGFEERRIMPGTWVCKNVSGCSMKEASGEFAWSMLAYISGSNSKKAKIEVDVPVLRSMNPAHMLTEGCDKEYTMCFWLPQQNQEDPPKPIGDRMYLYQSRGPVVYVKSYVGPMEVQDEVFTRRATKFINALDQAGIQYKKEYVKSVTYDGASPDQRLTEMWLVKPEE